jgi:hypothetical protein
MLWYFSPILPKTPQVSGGSPHEKPTNFTNQPRKTNDGDRSKIKIKNSGKKYGSMYFTQSER